MRDNGQEDVLSWLRIDDRFSRNPKVTALTFKERWVWMDLLCYCASYGTRGYLPANISGLVPGATGRFLTKCGVLELVDVVGGELRVHDWEAYAPKDPTGAERQAAWRRRKPVTPGAVTEIVTEPSTSRVGAARVPVPSPSYPDGAVRPGPDTAPVFKFPDIKGMDAA